MRYRWRRTHDAPTGAGDYCAALRRRREGWFPMVTLLEAAHHLRGILPINRWTPLLGLLGMVLSLFVWRRLAARLHWRPLPTLLTVLSLLAVLTLTLAPKGWWGNHRSLAQCVPSNWADIGAAASHVGGGLESWLN